MSTSGVLLVEDDEAIGSRLAQVLESQGHAVRWLKAGGQAVTAAGPAVGLVILDLGLPDGDGVDVCRRLRMCRPDLSILILSARDQELDIVAGLDAGADDYLVKPFKLSELLARVRAGLRRAASDAEEPVVAGEVRLDLGARRAWRGRQELSLRPREFDLLVLLAANAGRVVTRERIMAEVWGTTWIGSTKTLDTHVLTLRRKLGDTAIATLRGVGYRLETP
jgi:DNA-binding response OmpR family regulator